MKLIVLNIKLLNFTAMFTFIGFLFISSLQAQDKVLQWHSFENAISIAEQDKKYILVDVWAPWCGWCKKMQNEVYTALSDDLSSHFVLTRLNRDDNESSHRYQGRTLTPLRLAQRLNIQSVPGIVILTSEGKYLTHINGFTKTENLRTFLGYLTEQDFN